MIAMRKSFKITTLALSVVTFCISCSKAEFNNRCSDSVICQITAQMPELNNMDFSADTKSSIESVLRIRWSQGDMMSVINMTTGKKLGGYIEALEDGTQVKFEGKQLVGSINPGDKLLFINDSEPYSSEEIDYSSSKIDISDQSGEMGSVPFCVYAEFTATAENSISIDNLKFSFLTNYVQLAVSGLPQNGTIDHLTINDISSSCIISIDGGKFVATPESGIITLSKSFVLNSKGNQMRYFSAFKSESQEEARKSFATYGDLVMQTSWVKAALDKGCYYQSIVTGFQSANFIKFSDLSFKTFCVENADTNGDGEVSYLEAAAVEEFSLQPYCPSNITSAEELSYFTSLTTCPSFAYCKNLTQISLPSSLQIIPSKSFCHCEALSQIEIPQNVKEIGDYAFIECKSLSQIIIPNSVTTLGCYLFDACYKLRTVVLPDSLTEIPEFMFCSCSSLSSIVIPEGVTKIGDSAFSSCGNLTEIKFPETLEEIGYGAFSQSKISQLDFPSSLKKIGPQSFVYISTLTEVIFPSSLEHVGACAFMGCSNLSDITIESANTQFENGAFSNTGLLEITIPEGTIELNQLFSSCTRLTKVTLPFSLQYICSEYTGSGLFSYCTNLSEITLPDGLLNIGNATFAHTSISRIDVPSSVRKIDPWAFSNCKYLTDVNLPNNLDIIERGAFECCNNLSAIEIPGADIGWDAFQGCVSLHEVKIAEGCESIGKSAFHGCTGLYNISLPSTLKKIENSAFGDCIKLETIDLPENLQQIEDGAFANSGITEITIPDSVLALADDNGYGEVFSNCLYLKKVTVGSGCSLIGGSTFRGCANLEEIHMKGIYPPTISRSGNLEISEAVKIYVPLGSKQLYATDSSWSAYSSQIIEE